MTAARQKKMTAMKPIHLAYSVMVLLQADMRMRIRVVVTQTTPIMTHIRLNIHSHGNEGGKQLAGLLWSVTQLIMSPSLVSPPTSVTIQSGKTKLVRANISAIRKRVPDIKVSLSIL